MSYRLVYILVILILASCGSGPKKDEKNTADQKEKPLLIPHYGEKEDDYYQPDELAGHVHKPHAKRSFNWEEHPDGKMIQYVNNISLREDEDMDEQSLASKEVILVIGDSHTDGVVNNSESYPNRLEQMLNNDSLNPSRTKDFEVLNAGVGYYGPQNYLGALRKYIHLKPSKLLVCIYQGNDFLDAIRIESENERLAVPKRTDAYYINLWKVDEQAPGYTGQIMNQSNFFKQYPEFIKESVKFTHRSLKAMRTICEENNVELFVAILPSKVEVEPHTDKERNKMVKELLKFEKKDIERNHKLSVHLMKWMDGKEMKYLDLTDGLKDQELELYWKKDLHLNHNGHQRVAELLYDFMDFNK